MLKGQTVRMQGDGMILEGDRVPVFDIPRNRMPHRRQLGSDLVGPPGEGVDFE